jgi:hypothetical protein
VSKAATKVSLNNLYYFNKKTQTFDLTYDQITRAAKFITRANEPNKTLGNKQAKTLLTAIADKIKSSKNGEIFIDHDWISTITDCLPEQNMKIMGQLADILDFKYRRSVIFEGKKRHYGLIVKFTPDGQKRLTNPELFYNVPSPQKVQKPSKVTPKKNEVMIEKNRSSYKYIRDAIEEINSSYAREFISESSIIKTETNTPARDPIQNNQQNNPATFAPCSLTEQEQVALTNREEKAIELERKQRTSKNTGMFAISDLMSKVLNEIPKTEEIPEIKQEEVKRMTDEQTRKMLLSKALCSAFGEQRSGEIQDDYKFVEQDQQKVCIQTKEMRLNDIEKAKIRKAIKSVYGEEVTIAMQIIAADKEEPKQEYETPVAITTMPKQNWLKFKANVKESKLLGILTNRLVKVIENGETIIVEAAPFFMDELTEGGNLPILEEAVVQTGITLELHYSGMNKEYTNNLKKPVVLTPEQIAKDREWIKIQREAIKELDN